MRRSVMLVVAAVLAAGPGAAEPAANAPSVPPPPVAELTADVVQDARGDGPDGKGNTDDDTWGFWFADGRQFQRLDLHTSSLSEEQRKKGIVDGDPKVRGPIAGRLPNPADSEGWLYHDRWDGRFEGVWGDKKAGEVIAYPCLDRGGKSAHAGGPMAITYRPPAAGKYTVTGKLTDLTIDPKNDIHDGASYALEVVDAAGAATTVAKGGPFGDGNGRPDSIEIKAEGVEVAAGQLIRLVILPNKWPGLDMTKVELRVARP